MTVMKNPDPRVPLLLLLSVTTGLVDAASVLGLGRVFTANMTGNVVFLGFAASGAPGFRVAPYLIGIAFFLTGALIGGRAGRLQAGGSERRWLMSAAVFETLLLWIAAGVAIGYDHQAMAPEWRMFAIIALTAVAMGFRNATIRQLKVTDLTTTVLTLTLTGLGADSIAAGGGNPNWGRRIAAVLAIFLGAAIGAALLFRFGVVAPLTLAGALILIGTAACAMRLAPGPRGLE
ncbi:YoaK family protein [Sphingomonas cynarae]|uniref:YoaK family protein n=1 Tax=Sphingomonas cynarae TaxID=930197 RepID=A0ABP7EHK9_9SPHN